MRDAIGRGDHVRRSGGTRGCRRCKRQDAGAEGAGDEGVDVDDDDEPDDDEPDDDEPEDDEEAESEVGVVELGVLDAPVEVSAPFVDVAELPDDFDDPPRLSVL